MRLLQAALDTPLDSPFSATLSVHGLHFTVCALSISSLLSIFWKVDSQKKRVCSKRESIRREYSRFARDRESIRANRPTKMLYLAQPRHIGWAIYRLTFASLCRPIPWRLLGPKSKCWGPCTPPPSPTEAYLTLPASLLALPLLLPPPQWTCCSPSPPKPLEKGET